MKRSEFEIVANEWLSIAATVKPPEGALAEDLRVWLRDAEPLDLWRVLRMVRGEVVD